MGHYKISSNLVVCFGFRFFESSAEFPPYLWGGIATLRGLDEKMRTGVTVRQFLGNMASLFVLTNITNDR